MSRFHSRYRVPFAFLLLLYGLKGPYLRAQDSPLTVTVSEHNQQLFLEIDQDIQCYAGSLAFNLPGRIGRVHSGSNYSEPLPPPADPNPTPAPTAIATPLDFELARANPVVRTVWSEGDQGELDRRIAGITAELASVGSEIVATTQEIRKLKRRLKRSEKKKRIKRRIRNLRQEKVSLIEAESSFEERINTLNMRRNSCAGFLVQKDLTLDVTNAGGNWFHPNTSVDYRELRDTLIQHSDRAIPVLDGIGLHSAPFVTPRGAPCYLCTTENLPDILEFIDAAISEGVKNFSVEVPAIKEWGCDGVNEAAYVAKIGEVLKNSALHLGVHGLSFRLDEPIVSGLRAVTPAPGHFAGCGLTLTEIANRTARWARLVSDTFNGQVRFVDVEAFPNQREAGFYRQWWTALRDALEEERSGLSRSFIGFDLDIDRVAYERRTFELSIAERETLLASEIEGLEEVFLEVFPWAKFGVIVWSPKRTSDEEFFEDTESFADMLHSRLWRFGRATRKYFESWNHNERPCRLGERTQSDGKCYAGLVPKGPNHLMQVLELLNRYQ